VGETREDPALGDLNRDFAFCFIPGLRRPRRENDRAEVLREWLIGPLQPGLVAARDHHATFQLIGDDGRGDAAEVVEGALMARDPVGDLLRARGFGEV
jgi:hypothetical protein